jgi:hypothetical protein
MVKTAIGSPEPIGTVLTGEAPSKSVIGPVGTGIPLLQFTTEAVTTNKQVAPMSATGASSASTAAIRGAPVVRMAGADVEQLPLKHTVAVIWVVPPPVRNVVNVFCAVVSDAGLAPPVAFQVISVKASAKDVAQSMRACGPTHV